MPNRNSMLTVIILLLGLSGIAHGRPFPKDKIFNVAFLLDGPGTHADGFIEQIEQEILSLTRGEFRVAFPAAKRVRADRSARGVDAAGDKLLADPSVNLVVAVGPLASHVQALKEDLPRPVIARRPSSLSDHESSPAHFWKLSTKSVAA